MSGIFPRKNLLLKETHKIPNDLDSYPCLQYYAIRIRTRVACHLNCWVWFMQKFYGMRQPLNFQFNATWKKYRLYRNIENIDILSSQIYRIFTSIPKFIYHEVFQILKKIIFLRSSSSQGMVVISF